MIPPSQSRTASLLEAGANVLAGYVTALLVQRLVYPVFGIETTFTTDILIALIFTGTSLLRAYLLRRLFVHVERQRQLESETRAKRLAYRLTSGAHRSRAVQANSRFSRRA